MVLPLPVKMQLCLTVQAERGFTSGSGQGCG